MREEIRAGTLKKNKIDYASDIYLDRETRPASLGQPILPLRRYIWSSVGHVTGVTCWCLPVCLPAWPQTGGPQKLRCRAGVIS